jgi:hypothetical protein
MNSILNNGTTNDARHIGGLIAAVAGAVLVLGSIAGISGEFKTKAYSQVKAEPAPRGLGIVSPLTTEYYLVSDQEQADALWALSLGEADNQNIVFADSPAAKDLQNRAPSEAGAVRLIDLRRNRATAADAE